MGGRARGRVAVVAVAAGVLFAGCRCGPVSYSAPVGIELRMQPGDVVGGRIEVAKNITTESGNPYGAFVNDAERELGGPPASIVVTRLTIALAAGSGVAALEEAIAGTVEVWLEMGDTSARYLVGDVTDPTGAEAELVELAVSFDSDTLPAEDYASLTSANFAVVLTADAAAGFEAGANDAIADVVFEFEAFE